MKTLINISIDYGAISTYGSFSYLKYGPIRLFSQLALDSDLIVWKLIWVAGHSGPETAEDSRTHFGIFAPGVTQLFPQGHIINLYPWEHNEVAPTMAAAMSTKIPIIAIHLTRPPVEIPNRDELGIASHLDASKGAYIIKNYDPNKDKNGVIIIRGTSSINSLISILPQIKSNGPNVKIIAAISWELFKLQSIEYQQKIISDIEWHDSMIITNGAITLMKNWISNRLVQEYSLSPDFDNRWRTGGSVDEIINESKLDSKSILDGINKFVNERDQRLNRLHQSIPKIK